MRVLLRASYFVYAIALIACTAGASFNPAAPGGTVGNPNTAASPQGALPSMLQVTSRGGGVIGAPKLQIITFNGDPAAPQLEDFVSKLASSQYWAGTTQEYGVGALQVLPAKRETVAWPAAVTDGERLAGQASDIEDFLAGKLEGAVPAYGTPDSSTVYVLFMPPGIQVSAGVGQPSSACDANVLAWHTVMPLLTGGNSLLYGVVVDCGAVGGLSEIDARTAAASHVIVETVTNPQLTGFDTFDAAHAAWGVAAGGAGVGSACAAQLATDADGAVKPADLPYAVRRMWSNQRSQKGVEPCYPVPAGQPTFNVFPTLTDAVTYTLGAQSISTTGVALGGFSKVLSLAVRADAAGLPIDVTVAELGTQALQLTLDKSHAQTNDILQLTLQASATHTLTQALVRVRSVNGVHVRNTYFVVTP